jgi:hypothetical protein
MLAAFPEESVIPAKTGIQFFELIVLPLPALLSS